MSQGHLSPRAEALALVHHHPGRLRLRAALFRERSELAVAVRSTLERLPGVVAVTHALPTGSLLIEYDPRAIEPDAIVSAVTTSGNLSPPLSTTERRRHETSPAVVAISAARKLNALAGELTFGHADLRLMITTALAGGSVWSWLREREADRLPRWDNLLYWSFNTFVTLHRSDIDRAAGAYVRPPHGANEPTLERA